MRFKRVNLPRYELCTRMRPCCHVTVLAICISCNTQIWISAPFHDRLQALQVQYWHEEGRGSKICIIHQNQKFLKQVFSKTVTKLRTLGQLSQILHLNSKTPDFTVSSLNQVMPIIAPH